jgi:hypothetical protein
MVPTLKNAFVGYAVGTSIAVIGLYIAFAIPIYLRVRAGEAFERGAWHLGRHYRWIDWVAVAWILFISIVFLLPFAKVGIPGNEGFTWDFVNYTPITVGAALLLFRRVVRPVGPQVVQGPSAAGRRGRVGPDRERVRGSRSSCADPRLVDDASRIPAWSRARSRTRAASSTTCSTGSSTSTGSECSRSAAATGA